jgi:hypothetical protein
VQGTQGTQGSLGPTGATGAQGAQGTQGSIGSASTVSGPTGPQGTQGTQGSIGSASTVPGPTGPTGAQGTQGTMGTLGSQGSQGSVGTNNLISPVVAATGSTNTPQPNALTDNIYKLTAQATAANFKITSGTANDGQYLDICIVATAATQNITWVDATFGYTAFYLAAATGGTQGGSAGLLPIMLPMQIKKGQRMVMQFQYDTANNLNRWVLLNRLIG